jgi:hypothetical protein
MADYGSARDVLVTVVFGCRCGKTQSDATSIVGDFGGNRINLRTVYYWHRLVPSNLNTLGASGCVARIISKFPNNGGVAKAKGGRQNGGAYVMSLSQLSLAFGAVIVRAIRQELSVISAVIGLILEQSITGADLSDTVIC